MKGVDDNLKRLFDYLKAEGLYDNTVIIYTGDQGFWLGENDYQDKRWAYDPSMRMPHIARPMLGYQGRCALRRHCGERRFPRAHARLCRHPRARIHAGPFLQEHLRNRPEPKGWKQAAYYRYWMHMAHHDNPGVMAMRTKTHKLVYYYGCNYDGGYQTLPAGSCTT